MHAARRATQQLLTNEEQVGVVWIHYDKMWPCLRSHCCLRATQWLPLWLASWQSRHYVMLFTGHAHSFHFSSFTSQQAPVTADATTRPWLKHILLPLVYSKLFTIFFPFLSLVCAASDNVKKKKWNLRIQVWPTWNSTVAFSFGSSKGRQQNRYP